MDLAEKKLFLLDLDGTVYLEERLLPGAVEFLRWVRARGGAVRYLTNNSSRGAAAGLEKLRRLGIEAQREAGCVLREEPSEDVTAVLVGYDTELTYQKVENACRLLARGADFLATNPDWACPTLFGFVPDCGAICQLISHGAGRAPHFIGKPDPTMIHLALEQTGYTPGQTLMVGDRLYTDIACGVHAGVDTALVLTGEASAQDAAASDFPPSLICRDLGELLSWLRDADGE